MRKIIINIIDSLSVRKYIQRVINLLSKWYSLASNPWKTLKLISFLWLPSVVKDTYLRFLIVIMTTKYALLRSLIEYTANGRCICVLILLTSTWTWMRQMGMELVSLSSGWFHTSFPAELKPELHMKLTIMIWVKRIACCRINCLFRPGTKAAMSFTKGTPAVR